MLTLYQAEWCPYSSAVRELLTELGIDFVARQVEPWPEQRETLRAETGGDSIPTLVTEDGDVVRGTRSIFRYLEEREPWPHAPEHRQRFLDHREARERDVPGQLVERAELRAPTDDAPDPDGDVTVADAPAANRYEIAVGGRTVGFANYGLRDNRIVFTHTEVDAACEGRGYGTRLVAFAVADARERGLEIVPLCPFVSRYVNRPRG